MPAMLTKKRRNMEDLEDLLYASDANEEKEKYGRS